MHPLVREIAAEMLQVGSRKQRLRTYRAFVSYMQVQGEALNSCRMDVEAFSQLLSNEQSNMGGVAWVLKELGNEGIVEAQCLRSCERLAEALCAGGSVQQATSLLDSILHLQGSDCPLTARERLLYLLPSQGKVSLAEELAQEMLDRAENAYGGHAESTLGAQFLMADILRLGGKAPQAEAMYRDVLAACCALRRDHPIALRAQSALGALLCDCGRYEEAEQMLRQVLRVHERADEASQGYLGSPSSCDEPCPPAHAGSARAQFFTRLCLALVLQKGGKVEAAKGLSSELLSLQMGFIAKLAFSGMLSDKLTLTMIKEAAQRTQRVLEKRVQALGSYHIKTAAAQSQFAVVLIISGNASLAEEWLRAALRVQEAELGMSHPDTLLTSKRLALPVADRGGIENFDDVMRVVAYWFSASCVNSAWR